MLVIDEFSELLTAKPDFIDMFIQIGRIGRSLGVHLLLASQRLEEGRLRGLETYLSYRVGLRTFSAAESRAALGVPDAYQLPSVPGSGYLKFGTDEMVALQGGVRLGHLPLGRGAEVARAARCPWTAVRRGSRRPPVPMAYAAPDRPGAGAGRAARRTTRWRTRCWTWSCGGWRPGRPAHQVWLPPLDSAPALDAAAARAVGVAGPRPARAGVPRAGALAVPLGLVDKPFEQRRDGAVAGLLRRGRAT